MAPKVVEIQFKDLRVAVAALNESGLIAGKIKLVGSPKETILQQFMKAMTEVPDDAEGKFPGPKAALDFYNLILDAEEKAAAAAETKPEEVASEAPSTEAPIQTEGNKSVKEPKPPKEKKEKVVKEKVSKFTRTDAFIETIKKSGNKCKLEDWNKNANALYAEKGGKDNLEQSKWEMQYLTKILVGFGYAEIKEGIISLK
jgi:hypothetical protein